jgi:hypothetical protein
MRSAWVVTFLLAACARPVPSPTPPPPHLERPSASTSAPTTDDAPVLSTADTPSDLHRPLRTGECGLETALDDLLGAQPAIRCDEHSGQSDAADAERIRACMLSAIKQRKAFSATLRFGESFDSVIKQAYLGRTTTDGYEVREFHYDSCPSGCGQDDPGWSSYVCSPLEDLRAACVSRSRRDKDEHLRHACERIADGQPRYPAHDSAFNLAEWLGVWCNQPRAVDSCPR